MIDEDHDVSDFAKLFVDNKHSLEYPTKFPSREAVLPPRVIDNGVDGATTETNDEEEISTSVPNTFPQPTITTIDDKVDDMDDELETG
jgi:hypothetical protein